MAKVNNEENSFLAELFEIVLSPNFYFNDGEMETVSGFERQEWKTIFRQICEADSVYIFGRLDMSFLNSAILNIWGYPHGMNSEIESCLSIDVTQENADQILEARCAKHRIGLVKDDS
ncbi:MAG: hypothetical protein ABJN65_07950 [Parasphingorhabdus sp.]